MADAFYNSASARHPCGSPLFSPFKLAFNILPCCWRRLCTAGDIRQPLRPCSHQHCPVPALILSIRALSLRPVPRPGCSTLSPLLTSSGDGRGGRGFQNSSTPSFCLLQIVFPVFSRSSRVPPLGQGASGDHPAGKSQHQGGGGAQEARECRLLSDRLSRIRILNRRIIIFCRWRLSMSRSLTSA